MFFFCDWTVLWHPPHIENTVSLSQVCPLDSWFLIWPWKCPMNGKTGQADAFILVYFFLFWKYYVYIDSSSSKIFKAFQMNRIASKTQIHSCLPIFGLSQSSTAPSVKCQCDVKWPPFLFYFLLESSYHNWLASTSEIKWVWKVEDMDNYKFSIYNNLKIESL